MTWLTVKQYSMKKIFFFSFTFIILDVFSSVAQFAPLTPPAASKTKPVIKQTTSPGLESAPTRTTPLQTVLTNDNYYLSAARVTIKTGNDNKESLSNITIELSVRDTACQVFAQENLTNELKVNSENTIGLEKSNTYIASYSGNNLSHPYSTSPTGNRSISLGDCQKYGLSLRIIYKPNFFADAWKIENVSIALEFRDAKGNLHASYGTKTITFANAATFLDDFDKRILICTADNTFNPLTSFVTKDFSKRW